MLKVNSCGCTIITEEGQYRALGLILDGLYFRLTDGRGQTIASGTVFVDDTDFTTLMMLFGGRAPQGVFEAVQESVQDRYLIPEGTKLVLREDKWTSKRHSGAYYAVVYVAS